MKELKIKKIKPMYTGIITTSEVYEDDLFIEGSSFIDTTKAKGSLKEYLTVLAVGTHVHKVEVGLLIWINPMRYAVFSDGTNVKSLPGGHMTEEVKGKIAGYDIPTMEVNDQRVLILDEGDIKFIIEESEEIEVEKKAPSIVVPDVNKPTLIVPDKKIILN